MNRKSELIYFESSASDPAPLCAESFSNVRFEELDPLGIVWHGRYASYLEDARAAFGSKYGLAYTDMAREGFMAPLVKYHLDFKKPLRFPQKIKTSVKLHWSDALRLNFSYKIYIIDDDELAAEAWTVQLITDMESNLLLVRPPYVEEFCKKWQEARFEK